MSAGASSGFWKGLLSVPFRRAAKRVGVPVVGVSSYDPDAKNFSDVADRLRTAQRPDSILYVNVLEHIFDDETELATVHRSVRSGGRVLIFVPALRWLYGSFDEHIGHHRRYTKSELEGKCRRAGFRIVNCRYFDIAGIVPWWLKYCLFKSSTMEAWAVKSYDAYVVPATRAIESIVRSPIGKNLLLIAEKP